MDRNIHATEIKVTTTTPAVTVTMTLEEVKALVAVIGCLNAGGITSDLFDSLTDYLDTEPNPYYLHGRAFETVLDVRKRGE